MPWLTIRTQTSLTTSSPPPEVEGEMKQCLKRHERKKTILKTTVCGQLRNNMLLNLLSEEHEF